MAAVARWAWRILNTALLAAGVWALWWQAMQLELLERELGNLVDYVTVIAERMH